VTQCISRQHNNCHRVESIQKIRLIGRWNHEAVDPRGKSFTVIFLLKIYRVIRGFGPIVCMVLFVLPLDIRNFLHFCRLWLFGLKNQSLSNTSGKTQSIRIKFGIRGQVMGWQHSGNFGHDWPILGKMGLGRVLWSASFFCMVNQKTFQVLRNGQLLPNLVMKRILVSCHGIRKDIFGKFSLYGSFAFKIWNRKSIKQVPHSEQATGHGMHCREILFTPRCSPRDREFLRSGQLFCMMYGCRATGHQSCPIFGFWPIFLIQNL